MQDEIKDLVKSRAEALPKDKRAKATISMWSAIKSKYGCSYKEVSEDQFTGVVGLVARLPLEGELLEREQAATAIQTTTEYDYQAARQHVQTLKDMSRVAVDDVLLDEFNAELAKLEKCIVSAWTEIDEAVHRMSHALMFLKRWRNKS